MSANAPRAARARAELRATTLLAAPLVVGQLSSMGMNVVDTVLAGRHGTRTLAAIGIGAPTWSLVILLCVGVLMAVPPSVAQLAGAGRRGEIAPLFRQALWLALVLGLVLWLAMRQSPAVLAHFISPEVMPDVAGFLHGISWGAPALALYFCLRYLAEGIGWAVPTMVIGVVGLVLLVPIGWILMNGWGGLPGRGAAGLGWATTVVLWLQVLAFAATLARSRRCADLGLFARWEAPRMTPIGALLRLGVPMGIAIFMEGSLFVATALIIATLGEVPIAAHQTAILVASAAFMVPLGIAMATTVRVGFAAGACDREGVLWAAAAGVAIAVGTQTLSAIAFLACGSWIAGLISADAAVVALAASLLVYAAVFQYADGLQALSGGALRGLKDTRVPAIITVAAYWGVGLPVGAGLGLWAGWGAAGLWVGLILGLSTAAVLLTWRFWRLAQSDVWQVSPSVRGANLGSHS